MTQKQEVLNYVNGQWERNGASDALDVHNPATGGTIATVGLSPAAEVDAAARAGLKAYAEVARDAGGRPRATAFSVEDAAGGASGRDRAGHH